MKIPATPPSVIPTSFANFLLSLEELARVDTSKMKQDYIVRKRYLTYGC